MKDQAVHALTIQAGPRALSHLRQHGLQAADVAIIAGAAGGPKGLILRALDQWLFGEWLVQAPRQRTLIGASIGAWRLAAACAPDPVTAFQRLGDLYTGQQFSGKPSPREISALCSDILQQAIGDEVGSIVGHPQHHLQILVARGRGLLRRPASRLGTVAGFLAASGANLAARSRLGRHFDRIVVGRPEAPLSWLATPFDGFETHFAPLHTDNLLPALLASGTLPLIMPPVAAIPHAPAGLFWDGGLIDYHLALPFGRLPDGLVLYPHFTDHLVPGWLDKALRWRRAGTGPQRAWLDNLVLLSPSPHFVDSLPYRKLPDRSDFQRHGQNHSARIAHWQTAMSAGEQLRDALAAFVARPDLSLVKPL